MPARSPALGTLSYASIQTPTHRRRTPAATVGRWLGRLAGLVLLALRLVILAVGYAIIGCGMGLRIVFTVIGAALLLVGGMRWSAVRSRLMRGANWVDVQTLALVRRVTRNPFSRARGED